MNGLKRRTPGSEGRKKNLRFRETRRQQRGGKKDQKSGEDNRGQEEEGREEDRQQEEQRAQEEEVSLYHAACLETNLITDIVHLTQKSLF